MNRKIQKHDRAVTVVTGGSRGIGAATALRLAREGHSVAIGYEHSRAAAEETAEAVRDAGGEAITAPVDIGVEEQVNDPGRPPPSLPLGSGTNGSGGTRSGFCVACTGARARYRMACCGAWPTRPPAARR